MASFKPALWVTAFVCVCLSLLCAVVKPYELPESPHPLAEELGMWVTVDFTTGLEGSLFHNESNVDLPETAWLEDILTVWMLLLKDLLTVPVVLLKDVLRVSMVLLTVSVVFALKFILLASGMVGMTIFLRRAVWPMVFGMAVGVLNGVLKRVASVRDAVVVTLGNYLASVTQGLTAVKGNLKLKLIRAVEGFPAPTDVLDKMLEWVIPPRNAGFERFGNFLGTPPKDPCIHFTPISLDHKPSLQLEEYEDDGLRVEDSGPGIQLDPALVGQLALEVAQKVVETEAVEAEAVKLELEHDLFKERPYCHQTIFTANSSKDIEGLPRFINPKKGQLFYLEMARRVLAKAEALCSQVRPITPFRVPRRPCRRSPLLLRSRLRTKKAGSASRVLLLVPGPAIGQSISEVLEGIEVFSSRDGECVDVPVFEEEAEASIGHVVNEGKEELRPQVFLEKEEVVQQPDRQVIALTTEPAPNVKIKELWKTLRAVGLAASPLGELPSVGVDVVGSGNAEEARASLKPTYSGEAKEAIEPPIEEGSGEPHLQVLPQQEEAQALLERTTECLFGYNGSVPFPDTNDHFPPVSKQGEGYFYAGNGRKTERSFFCQTDPKGEAEVTIKPTVEEGLNKPHPQMLSRQEEAIQQPEPPATALACGQVPEASYDDEPTANLQAADLVTEQLGAAPGVDVNVTGPSGMSVTVEEAQAPPEQTTKREAEAEIEPMVVEELGELPLQASWHQEVIQQAAPLAPEPEHIPEPMADINELWANLLAAGLVTGPMGDTPGVDVNIEDPWGVPLIVEEAGAPLTPTIGGRRGEYHPQAFFQQEGAIQQACPPWSVPVTVEEQSLSLAYEEEPEVNFYEVWGNLRAAGLIAKQSTNSLVEEEHSLDSTYSQTKKSPPYHDPVADLTRYSVPEFGNGGSASMTPISGAHEPAPMNSPPVGVVTEGADAVEFGGRVAPAFLFGDAYATTEGGAPPPSPPPRVVSAFDFRPPGRRGWGSVTTPSTGGSVFVFGNAPQFPPPTPTPTQGSLRHSAVPGPSSLGFFGDNGDESLLIEQEEDPSDEEIDEEQKIYWADSMPEELRTSRGYHLGIPKAQIPKSRPSFPEYSGSDITEFSDSELYELFEREKALTEGESNQDEQDSIEGGDEEDSIEEELEEEVHEEEGKVRCATAMPTHTTPPVYCCSEFAGGAGNAESDSDEIKWADSMPAHFRTPDHTRAIIPGKVEKDTEESRGELGYNRAEWVAASMLLQLADPQFAGNELLENKEEDGDEEQSAEFGEPSDCEMGKGEHEGEDEDRIKWEPFMPASLASLEPSKAEKGVEGGIDLSRFLFAAGDREGVPTGEGEGEE